ncbi:hypothetical protein ABFY60_11140 [Lysinibacillus pakistanensis]|uniref:hypothetical protein n=1 Tax=Lysinibacillus pakistanensis TaxID=759811 RepID=UPI003D2AF414
MLGTGTQQDPFVIETPIDYDSIFVNANLSKHFILGNDIDFTGHNVPRYDSSKNFTGSFDGKGFTVKNVDIVHNSNTSMLPTIRQTGIVRNVRFENVKIVSTSNTIQSYSGILGNVNLGGTADNIEVANSYFDSGSENVRFGIFRSIANGSTCTNIKFDNVTVKGGKTGIGFIGTFAQNAIYPDNVINNIVATGKLLPVTSNTETDGLFAHKPDGTLHFENTYVLDKDIPSFDHSLGCSKVVTDSQLKDASYIALGNKWSHSDGNYPELIAFSANAGKEVTVRKTITARTISIESKQSRNLSYQRSINVGKGSIAISARHYSTRSGLTANKIEFTSKVKKINVQRVNSTINVKSNSMEWIHYKNALRVFPIDFRHVEVLSNVIYPIGDNVPVYAYVGLISNMSTVQLRNNQTSICRIL